MTKSERNPNDEFRKRPRLTGWSHVDALVDSTFVIRTSFGFRSGMPGSFGFLFALVVLACSPLKVRAAAAGTNSPAGPSNRYLFVLNTSRAMEHRTEGVLGAVQDLLASAMRGQLRRGDTIGVWTFSSGLYAGQFPLQEWSPEAQRTVAARVFSFLKEQTYGGSANINGMILAMQRLIKDSPFITIIL